MDIVDYLILSDPNVMELQMRVQAKNKEGWQPFGSLQAVTPVLNANEVAAEFIQPVVKYGERQK